MPPLRIATALIFGAVLASPGLAQNAETPAPAPRIILSPAQTTDVNAPKAPAMPASSSKSGCMKSRHVTS